jgi:recombination protein RecR
MTFLAQLDRLTACLARLPGVGRRSAERMALRLVRDQEGLLRELSAALEGASAALTVCGMCGTVTSRDGNPCRLCTDPSRDDSLLCVVEDPNDIARVEESGGFRGRYHALMGTISPMKGIGPRDLRVRALMEETPPEPGALPKDRQPIAAHCRKVASLKEEIKARAKENVAFIQESLQFLDEIISIFATGGRAEVSYDPMLRRQKASPSFMYQSEV